MPKLDESRPFVPVNIAVLTVSDTRTRADDTSGDTLQKMIEDAGHKIAARAIVPDDVARIRFDAVDLVEVAAAVVVLEHGAERTLEGLAADRGVARTQHNATFCQG